MNFFLSCFHKMKNVLHKLDDDDDDLIFEDDEPKFEELRFKDLLDVSFMKMYFYRTCKYFSKINCHIGPPYFVYYIHIVLTFLQLISPCFLLNSTIIWTSDSTVSFVFQIIFAVSRGWYLKENDYARRVISIVCFFVILLFDILLEYLKRRFQYRQIISDLESKIVLSIYKYFIPHLYPLLICGFPGAVKSISNDEHSFLNYFDIAICPLLFIYELVKYFKITKRVLLESNPSFSLNSTFLPLTITIITINNLIDCAIIPSEKAVFRIILLIFLFIIYLITGIFHSILIPYVSQIYSHLFSSVCLSCSITILINIVCINLNISIQFITLIIFVILTVIFYLINLFITNKSIIKYLHIFEEISNFPDDETENFNRYFKNKIIFFRAVQISLFSWDPYFLSWKPFRLSYEKWPESELILIIWAKIVSIFPQESSLFERLTTKIIQNPKISLNCRLQFRYIYHTRITTMIPSLKAFFVSFDKASHHAINMYKSFFENILYKNTLFFWKNVADITKQVQKLDFAIQKNLDAYPNNIEVIHCYCNFLKAIKLDPSATIEWKKRLELLKYGKKLKGDIPYTAALPIYHRLADNGAQTEEVVSLTDNDENNSELENDEDEDHFKLSLSTMIKSSKIGKFLIPFVLIIIGVIVFLCSFFYYLMFYRSKFINFFYKVVYDVNDIDDSILSCCRLEFYASQLITFLGSDINRTEILKKLAPSLTGRNSIIPQWTFDVDDVIMLANYTRELIENLPSYFTNFDLKYSQKSMKAYSLIFDDKCNEKTDLTCHSQIVNSITELIKLIENSPSKFLDPDQVYIDFITNMNDFYSKLIDVSYLAISTIENTNVKTLESMNNIMTLSILLDLILISLPYIFCIFYFGLLSHDISQSFLSLQTSAVTDIIMQLSANSSIQKESSIKKEDSSLNKTLPIQQRRNYLTASIYMILFVLSFAPMTITFLVIYFLAQYSSNIEKSQIYSLIDLAHPISLIYYKAYLFTEVYNAKFIYPSNESINYFVEKGKEFIKLSNSILKNGLFKAGESLDVINKYATQETKLDFRSNFVLTGLENLLRSSYLGAIDLIDSMFVYEFNKTDEMVENDEFFYQISYYLTNWAIKNRDTPFFTSLFTNIKNNFKKKFNLLIPLFVCIAIFQIFVVVISYFALLSNYQYFKSVLNFFLFFKPSLIIQNDQITSMICQGGVKSESAQSSVKNSEKILTQIPEAVVILNKSLNIVDHNKAFNKLVSVSEPLINKQLTELMLYRKWSGFNIDHLERRLNGLLKGKEDPNFSIFFSFLTTQNKPLYVKATVISLSQNGALNNETQYKQITMIAIVFDDQTVKTIQYEQITSEQSKIQKGLQKVIPTPIVEEINNSIESISFNVQFAAIGNIYIETDPFNSADGFKAPFRFYDDMFSIFDECIKNSSNITKLKAFSKIYTFSCGIFDDSIKQEKMALEAVQFSLSLIQMQRKFEEKVNRRISLCIGLECGGPLVAGFVSLNRPNFMVIGEVAEMSHSLAITGIPGKVQISEFVQELTDGFNFNVQERGEAILINGNRTKTFYITT